MSFYTDPTRSKTSLPPNWKRSPCAMREMLAKFERNEVRRLKRKGWIRRAFSYLLQSLKPFPAPSSRN